MMWKSWFCKNHKTPREASEEEDEVFDETLRQDSVFRFYSARYSTELQHLEQELMELASLGRDAYAVRCAQEVQDGTRGQKVLCRIKALKKELRFCRYRTTQTQSLAEVNQEMFQQKTAELPVQFQRQDSLLQLPDWLKRSLEDSTERVRSPDQERRLREMKESSVLKLAGHAMVPSSLHVQGSRYHEVFTVYDPTQSGTLSRFGSLKRTPSASDLNINQ